MANFEARKVLMKDAQGRYVIPFTGAVETVNGQKPDENGNVVIEGVDTTTLLTKAVAAETYLSKADASTTYLNVDTAAGTFLSKTDAASTYLKAGTAADTFLSKADASSTYLTQAQANSAYLGVGDKAVSAETADNAVSATMASKAISDINGNAIATTYATNQNLFSDGGAGSLLRSDIMPIQTVDGYSPDANGNIDTQRLPLSGGTMTGAIVRNGLISRNSTDGNLVSIRGGTDATSSRLVLFGKNNATNAGQFQLISQSEDQEATLIGFPDGTLIWRGKEVERVRSSGTNYIRFESGLQICWGTISVTSTGGTTNTLPVAFIDKSYRIAACLGGEDNVRCYTVFANVLSTTTFKGKASVAANGGAVVAHSNVGAYYIAVGFWK